jgi:hypothetical protein
MSINGWINHLIDEERLHLLKPVFESDEAGRTLLVSPEIWRLIEGPWATEAWGARCSKLRADLESFASGAEIHTCTTPFKARDADLGLLAPVEDGVWDIRSRNPRPGLRLIGQFIERDTFVALIPASRSKATEHLAHGPLNDRDSPEWRAAIRVCTVLFRSLFHPYVPIGGDDIRDVLSSSYNPI